jgi:YD repeat-containing protein
MYRRALLPVFVVVAHALFLSSEPLRSQEVTPMPQKKSSTKSDREKAELRGLVRQVTEERTTPASPGFPETTFSTATEYDREGRTLSSSHINSDSSTWTSAFQYDAQGRLLKTSSGQPGGPLEVTVYRYDEEGRLGDIEGKNPFNESTTFQYDARGRKTRIVKSTQPASPEGLYGSTAMSASLEGEDLYYPVPQGGMTKTLYDDSDRATELQICDSDGRIIQRFMRSYNDAGRIAETKVVIEDMMGALPAKEREQLLAEPGAAEELKSQLSALLGARREMFKTSYSYNAEGQLAEKRDHLGYNLEMVAKFMYDNNGNKIEERTTTSGDANPPSIEPASQDAIASPQESVATYNYKYDSHGNWIEQIARVKSGPDAPIQDSTVCRRTIFYY